MSDIPTHAPSPRRARNPVAPAVLAGLIALACAGGATGASAAQNGQRKTVTIAASTTMLQLGLYADEGGAWWAWQKLQRGQPGLADGLIPQVVALAPDARSGVVLRAALAPGVDAPALCRRMVGAGFGCLVLKNVPAPADLPSPVPSPAPAQVPAAAPAAAQEIAFAPLPRMKPEPPPQPEADRAADTPPNAPLPPVATLTRPPVMPVVARTLDEPPPPPTEGTYFYSPDEAQELVEIEKRSRRLGGRLGAVLPDTKFEVAPAVLKRSEWNLCALTFDDGPHRVHTPKILEILNREKVRATYFPIARVAVKQPEIIKAFLASGHEIGSHSLTHANLRPMPAAAQRFEIVEANRILRGMGANPVLFRPPYGRYSMELLSIIRNEGMIPVLWNVDTRDWQVRDPDKIVEHVKTADGTASVLLMHSTYPTSASALPGVIEGLRAKGCEFVTLSDWIEKMRTVATPMMVNEPVVSANVTLTGTARP